MINTESIRPTVRHAVPQEYTYRFPLPPRIDFDDARKRALMACYDHALKDGLFPVARPKTTYHGGERFMMGTPDYAYLEVRVLCAP